jgi:HSP20 family protein
MSISDLIPWKKEKKQVPVRRGQGDQEMNSIATMRDSMDRLFDDFFRGFGLAPYAANERWSSFMPHVDIVENDRNVQISAELPGMDEDDVQLSISGDALVISGEKREDKQTEGKDYYYAERSYGTFRRTVPLPSDIDQERASAVFERGVLTVTMPKTQGHPQRKRIPIKTG